MMDIRLALMTGIDFPIEECQLVIHQPTIKEISYIGEEDFFIGLQTVCLYKTMFTQDKTVLETITNFQIFMTIMLEKEAASKKQSVLKLFQLIFKDYKVYFSPKSIIFQKQGQQENIFIDEQNFDIFQEKLRTVFCLKTGPMDQQTFNPKGAKAKEIADKIMRGRAIVAAQKGGSNSSIFTQYASILVIALHIPLSEIINLTMFQLYDMIERHNLYMQWDLYVRQKLAGGNPEQQPESWMKDLHDSY